MHVRNIILLTACQLISATGSIVVVTLGGIIGANLSDNAALATLPVSIMVVSVASTTIPATMLMRAIGRRRSFSLSSLSAAAAVLLATFALRTSSFDFRALRPRTPSAASCYAAAISTWPGSLLSMSLWRSTLLLALSISIPTSVPSAS